MRTGTGRSQPRVLPALRLLSAIAGAPLLAVPSACGRSSLGVEEHPHPDYARAEPVDAPPPPPQVEHVSDEAPGPGCRWVDGQWTWVRRRWEWQRGRWVLPPDSCQHSAPSFHWVAGGAGEGRDVLYYLPGRWYSVTERRPCPSVPACPGTESFDPAAPPTSSP